jgi:hypothetical protein
LTRFAIPEGVSSLLAKPSRSFALATLAAIWLGACYDMPLIPEDSVARAGSAGHGKAGEGAGGRASAGFGGTPASAGAPHTNGGAKPNGGGFNAGSGGKNTGSAGTTGQAGSGGMSSITWLGLSGSSAPSSFAVNAELGIEGSFYAYSDECSQSKLTWDAQNRCASGTICKPGGNNWGVSIGFDFHYTGSVGTPPDTKLTWNPQKVGARGIAWRIHGTAPKLQVWVLNMDPSWQGQCNGMPCEISGPPDGIVLAPLNGELHFDNMMKDDWGNTGIPYQFDPAAVFALQFKISSLAVGDVEFNFCIDELGILQ